jgi:hypothetical protein
MTVSGSRLIYVFAIYAVARTHVRLSQSFFRRIGFVRPTGRAVAARAPVLHIVLRVSRGVACRRAGRPPRLLAPPAPLEAGRKARAKRGWRVHPAPHQCTGAGAVHIRCTVTVLYPMHAHDDGRTERNPRDAPVSCVWGPVRCAVLLSSSDQPNTEGRSNKQAADHFFARICATSSTNRSLLCLAPTVTRSFVLRSGRLPQ